MATSERPPAIAPCASGVPVFGSVLELQRDPLAFFTGLREQHGPVACFRAGPVLFTHVTSPAGIRRILVENMRNYDRGLATRALKIVLGRGILTAKGEDWARERKRLLPAFSRERMQSFFSSMVEITDSMLHTWAERADAQAPLDVHNQMNRLTLSVVTHTLLGSDSASVLDEVSECVAHLNHFVYRANSSLLPLPIWFPAPSSTLARKSLARLNHLVNGIIERRKREPGDTDLVSLLLASCDESGGAPALSLVRDEVMTMLLAGHETSSNALSWCLQLLAQNPQVMPRLYAEIDSKLPQNPQPDDILRLSYTSWVLQEAMRLYPPVWFLGRQAEQEDVIGGFRIPRRSQIAIVPYVVHRDPTLWKNPEAFDPERFSPEATAEREKFAYLPFGAGPRQCIGRGFAMLQMQLTLAMILRRYAFRPVSQATPTPEPLVTMRPKQGVHLRLEERVNIAEQRPLREVHDAL